MNRCSALMLCAALLAGGVFAQTNDDTVTTEKPLPGFARDLRISAMIKNADGIKVGIVNTAENWNKFIEVGEAYGGIEVVEADYDTEVVVLRKGDETIRLFLATDPNAEVAGGIIDEGTPMQTAWKGEGIESYLREHPELRNAATSPAVGMGDGIERALREQAELQKAGKLPAPTPTPILTPPPQP